MEVSTLLWFIGILVGFLNLWFWYDKNKSDKDLSEYKKGVESKFTLSFKELSTVATKQTEHDNKFVTDQRVRDIVKDEIKPLKDDVSQMKIDISKIMEALQDLATELKVYNAIRDYEKTK